MTFFARSRDVTATTFIVVSSRAPWTSWSWASRAKSRSSPARAKASVGRPPSGSRARARRDRKSTRLNSSHSQISYAVFCLKKKKYQDSHSTTGIQGSLVRLHYTSRYVLIDIFHVCGFGTHLTMHLLPRCQVSVLLQYRRGT